jgi:hypothetical protein
LIYRHSGIVSFEFAANEFRDYIANGHTSWLIAKLCVAIAIAIGCNFGAQFRRIATVKL